MLRDVKTIVTDNLLGINSSKGDGVHVKIGASPVVSSTPIIITGSMSAAKIKAKLGLSPLADAAMDAVDWGSNLIICIPVAASTAGTLGAVTKTGTSGGTVTISGTPNNAFDIVIKITATGTLNTGSFKASIDGGYSFTDELTVPLSGNYELTGTGVTVKFTEAVGDAANSFAVGDAFKASTTKPAMTNSDVLAAITKLQTYSDYAFEYVHIVGESTAALWAAVSTAQAELNDTYKKPMFFMLEAYTPNTEEAIDDYAERLENDRKQVKNYNIQVVAARGMLVKMDGTTREVNLAGLVSGLYSKASVQVCIGKTLPAAGFGVSKSKLVELRPSGVMTVIERLDTANYLTFREYDGLDDFYVYHTFVLSPDDSDYRYAEDVRVLNKIIRKTRAEALKLLQDDIDLDDIQGELETRAKFMFPPLQDMINAKEISSAALTVPEGQESTFIETQIMKVKIRYVDRGHIREVEVDLGRSPAGE